MPGESISKIAQQALSVNPIADLLMISQATGNPSAPYITRKITPGLIAGSPSANAVPFASLPASPAIGQIACVNNSSVNIWGGTADGAGSDTVLVWFNGNSVWTVIGK